MGKIFRILASPLAAVVVAFLWTLALGISYAWNARHERDLAVGFARQEAVASFSKDLVYRRWASLQGGVYVPAGALTPPNPYLKQLSNRDLTGPDGRLFTLVNPAYMTRQVHTLAAETFGVQGHITSLRPIRPENRADEWESNALRDFEAGIPEKFGVVRRDGSNQLRFMRPMIVEASCLKCHASQGYRAGEVRGGISISVPLLPYERMAEQSIRGYRTVHLLAWFPVVAFLFWFWRIGKKRRQEQESSLAALHANQEKLRTYIDMAPEGILVLDGDGRIIDGNPAASALAARSVEELRRMAGDSLICDEPAVTPGSGRPQRAPQSHLIRPDGRRLPVMVDRVRLGDGQQIWFLRDLTERQRLEQDLVHREKLAAVGSLAGGVAHEFNNLLSIIRLQAQQLLSEDGAKSMRHQALIAELIQQTRRGAAITRGMLAVSRPPSGTVKPCRMEELVEEVLAFQASALIQERIEVARDFRSTGRVAVDRDQVAQVLLNLVINARHAMLPGGGGILRVATRDGEGELIVEVGDTGIGMSAEILEKIFTPFFTTKGAYARDGLGLAGTGLGLAVSARVVEQFGGRIAVESREGEGSVFRLFFPSV